MVERLAPVDEYGMPYAIYPSYTTSARHQTYVDDDHAFYRRLAPELTTVAGLALRYSRVHVTERWLHDRKHHLFPDGLEEYPRHRQDMFGLVILSCAGYLSRVAMDLSSKNRCNFVTMPDEVYEWVRGKNKMHFQTVRSAGIAPEGIYPRRTQDKATYFIGKYLTTYARRQNLDHIKDTDYVDEFLHTSDVMRRFELGKTILDEAVRVAVEPISPMYQHALDRGLIRSPINDPVSIVKKFNYVGAWDQHVEHLQTKLIAA